MLIFLHIHLVANSVRSLGYDFKWVETAEDIEKADVSIVCLVLLGGGQGTGMSKDIDGVCTNLLAVCIDGVGC